MVGMGPRVTTTTTTMKHALFAFAFVGCAQAKTGTGTDGGVGGDAKMPDASCGTTCDGDKDGVYDQDDQCPMTPASETVNDEGCADSQLTATLQPFPPFNLTWTPTGDPGKAGGLIWNYDGIEREDLFHIYWLVCDDPATPCGISLDGPLDVAAEYWAFSAADSNLAAGRLVFTNTTHKLDDHTTPQLSGRLTIVASDASVAIPFADVATLKVTPRSGLYGVEVKGVSYKITVLGEVQDPQSQNWVPYVDYYNAAPTPTAGGGVTSSFGGSFYAK
jgi:hypothetical protein